MQEVVLPLELGRATGSGPSRRLRLQGKVPATVYGLGKGAVTASVDYRALRGALSTEAGLNVVLNLDVAGRQEMALVKEMQRHPLRGDVTHVDFLRVEPDSDVAVEVPIRLAGQAAAVLDMNGIVERSLDTLRVLAKPRSIPNELVLDVSELTVGSTLTVADLELPAGVTALVDESAPVVSGIITRSALEAAAEAEAEEAEAESEGDGDGEGAAEDDSG
ncbi:MAG: 50S ribosomal protein L25 [Acidimicrobiia bacterium]|nr:50S ribosomal protein L25 [bacterium]MYB23725.1 50S ribosomal protein L25 [Acidimicrobiia bacterium]